MRWDCKKGENCFNKKRRPKIEVFAQCFPGFINFGDVDGIVEVNGYFAILEWKGPGGTFLTAQKILATRFTKFPGNIYFLVYGDAETMAVSGYEVFEGGTRLYFQLGKMPELLTHIKAWTDKVLLLPRP